MNYFVILFKNNKKKKILKSFVTENKAKEFYNKKLKESRKVLFKKTFENGSECQYRISLVSKLPNQEQIFYTDELGRNIIINPKISDDKYITIMDNYFIEEKIFDLNNSSKITTEQFIKKYLKKSNFYMISKINNKIIVQNDLDINLFSCKTDEESERFLTNLPFKRNVLYKVTKWTTKTLDNPLTICYNLIFNHKETYVWLR